MPNGVERRHPSPLRYPGGKGKISNYLRLLFLENELVGHEYVEVYAGGAAVALSLLFEEYASHIHINDIDRGIHAFWSAVLTDTERLCQRIADTPVTVREWEDQRSVQEAWDPEPIDLAFSTFFLNRTNRSGIIMGGIIGGRGQAGEWGIDARFNKPDLIRRIRKVARHSSRITLTRMDGAEYLQAIVPTLPASTFLYLDPPYYVKGGSRLYLNYYEDRDHEQIASLIRAEHRPWVVSYDRVPEVEQWYQGVPAIHYGLSYSAADRYRGGEVMFFGGDVLSPDIPTPANITAAQVSAFRRKLLSMS